MCDIITDDNGKTHIIVAASNENTGDSFQLFLDYCSKNGYALDCIQYGRFSVVPVRAHRSIIKPLLAVLVLAWAVGATYFATLSNIET